MTEEYTENCGSKTIGAQQICVRRTRVNNLKSISLDIPLGQIVVLVGVSGSGKTSLAFETIHIEGQRRFLETLSPGIRQRFASLERPDVDEIESLPPTIALRQSESLVGEKTVGEFIELSQHLRSMAEKFGLMICPNCDHRFAIPSSDTVAEFISQRDDGTKCQLGFISHPLGKEPRNLHEHRLQQSGFQRLIERNENQFLVILDRIVIGKTEKSRIEESIESAHHFGNQSCVVLVECNDESEPPNEVLTDDSGRKWRPYNFFLDPRCPACENRSFDAIGQVCDECLILDNITLYEWGALSVEEMTVRITAALERLPDADRPLMTPLVERIANIAAQVQSLGIDYLPSNRLLTDVSSGELIRLRLARILSLDLVDTLFILDEPASHLHPEDIERLIPVLQRIVAHDNSVLLVEHNEHLINSADTIIEIGPGAGDGGGEITFIGMPDEFNDHELQKKEPVEIAENRPNTKSTNALKLRNAIAKNLKNIDVTFPLNGLCVVTGVSGSGKSALVSQALIQALNEPGKTITGMQHIDEFLYVTSQPDARNPRSCPVTSLKIWDEVRETFAETNAAKTTNVTARDFSLHVNDGARCRRCKGVGYITLEMQFLDKLEIKCPDCRGNRFEERVLDIKYRGKSIAEVLQMSIEEATGYFRSQPKIQRKLQSVREVGLGYLSLGRPLNTLSGGETQRLKLASVLGSQTGKRILFLFDEPTAGLHKVDVARLIGIFQRLIDVGHSIITTTHSRQLIDVADHVIELGPGAGNNGGVVIKTT